MDTHAAVRMLTAGGADEALAVAVVDVAQSAAADHGRELTTRSDLDHLREAHRADLAALKARLTWRFAGAMLAQTLAILSGVVAILRLRSAEYRRAVGMRRSRNEIRTRVADFAREWVDAAYKRGEPQSFSNEFLDTRRSGRPLRSGRRDDYTCRSLAGNLRLLSVPRKRGPTMNSVARVFPMIAAVLLTVLVPRPAFGQRFAAEASLATVPSVRVTSFLTIEDTDRDCAPDTRVLATEAELVFRRSGVSVVDGSSIRFAIDLVVFQTGGDHCVAAYSFRLLTGIPGTGLANLLYYYNVGVMSGPHHDLQDRLRNGTNQVATDLANEILNAKSE